MSGPCFDLRSSCFRMSQEFSETVSESEQRESFLHQQFQAPQEQEPCVLLMTSPIINISIKSSIIRNGISADYSCYHIHITPQCTSSAFVIFRRFRDFMALQAKLLAFSIQTIEFDTVELPKNSSDMQRAYPLPHHGILSVFCKNTLCLREERCRELASWLHSICINPAFRECPILITFLTEGANVPPIGGALELECTEAERNYGRAAAAELYLDLNSMRTILISTDDINVSKPIKTVDDCVSKAPEIESLPGAIKMATEEVFEETVNTPSEVDATPEVEKFENIKDQFVSFAIYPPDCSSAAMDDVAAVVKVQSWARGRARRLDHKLLTAQTLTQLSLESLKWDREEYDACMDPLEIMKATNICETGETTDLEDAVLSPKANTSKGRNGFKSISVDTSMSCSFVADNGGDDEQVQVSWDANALSLDQHQAKMQSSDWAVSEDTRAAAEEDTGFGQHKIKKGRRISLKGASKFVSRMMATKKPGVAKYINDSE